MMALQALSKEVPYQFRPSLAQRHGLNEAIFIEKLHVELQALEGALIDGIKWIHHSIDEWCKLLPFWSRNTIQSLIKQLVQRGIVRTGNFNEELSRRKWYTLDYDAMDSAERPKRKARDDQPNFGEKMKKYRMSKLRTHDDPKSGHTSTTVNPKFGQVTIQTLDNDLYNTKNPYKESSIVPSVESTETPLEKPSYPTGSNGHEPEPPLPGGQDVPAEPKPSPVKLVKLPPKRDALFVALAKYLDMLPETPDHIYNKSMCQWINSFKDHVYAPLGMTKDHHDYERAAAALAGFAPWCKGEGFTPPKTVTKFAGQFNRYAQTLIPAAPAKREHDPACPKCFGTGGIHWFTERGKPPYIVHPSTPAPRGVEESIELCDCHQPEVAHAKKV